MTTKNDTVVGIRLQGTDNWGYEDDAGKLAFGPMNARTLFFDKSADREAISSHMSAAQEQGQRSIEQVPVRRSLEVLENETV